MAKVGIAGLALRNTGGIRAGRPISTKELLHQKIDEVGDAAALAAMEHAGGMPSPQPASIQDVTAMAKVTMDGARQALDMQKAQTESARQERDEAREDRDAAYAGVQAQVDRAVAEQRQKDEFMAGLLDKSHQQTIEILQQQKEDALKSQQGEHDSAVARLEAKIDGLAAAHKTEVEQLKKDLADAQAQVRTLQQRPTANDELLDLLASENPRQHRLARAVLSLVHVETGPVQEDPQTQLYREAIPSVVDRLDKENSKIDKADARADRLANAGVRVLGVLERRLGGPGILLAEADLPDGAGPLDGNGFIDPAAADAEYARQPAHR